VRWRISRTDGKCTLIDGIEKKGIWQALISEDELSQNQKAAQACPVKIIRIVK
jgi:ferredoxin